MHITVVNYTERAETSDAAVLEAIRAVNRQVAHDFEPYWDITAAMKLAGRQGKTRRPTWAKELRGDAILYIADDAADDDGLDGFHATIGGNLPYGVVYTLTGEQLDPSWTVTFSHEVLELIGDPHVNRLVCGPDPRDRRRRVYHWLEMCDAVQDEHYEIDGVLVSNFVLPSYFTIGEERGSRNDFLGKHPLRSFGVNPGGYVGFWDPRTRRDHTFEPDARARQRRAMKRGARKRRSMRYRQLADRVKQCAAKG